MPKQLRYLLRLLARVSLQGKITGGYGVLFLLLLVVGYFGLQGIQRQSDDLKTLASYRQFEVLLANLERQDLEAYAYASNPVSTQDTALLHAEQSIASNLEKAALPADLQPGFRKVATAQAAYAHDQLATPSGKRNALSSALAQVLTADRNFRSMIDGQTAAITRAADRERRSSETSMAVVTAVSILLTFLIGRFLARRISTPAVALAAAARQAAAGDLSRDVPRITSGDEVENLSVSLGQLMDSLRNLLARAEEASQQISELGGNIHGSAENISRVAEYTTDTVHNLSERAASQVRAAQDAFGALEALQNTIAEIGDGASAQAAHVDETSALVGQMAQAIDEVAGRAQAVASAATQSTNSAKEGGQVVDRAIASMEELKDTIYHGAERMRQLGEHSARIGEIVQVISDIADQTNLLALNAAIEAARAGENGRGFAVVADEVRKLAERSSTATKEIAALIAGVQEATGNAVASMENGTRGAGAAVSLATSAGQALHSIVEMIEQAAGQIEGISAATEELAASSSEVVKAVDAVAQISNKHAVATGEVTREAAQVLQFVQELTQSYQEMSSSVDDISTTAALTSDTAAETVHSAQTLSQIAGDLTSLVHSFQR